MATWYLRNWVKGPRTSTALKQANVTAQAVVHHLNNIESDTDGDGIGNLLRRPVQQSLDYVAAFTQVAYTASPVTDFGALATKPEAPAVCVWDRLSAFDKERCADLGFSQE